MAEEGARPNEEIEAKERLSDEASISLRKKITGLLTAEPKKLSTQARFIAEVIDGVVSICDKPEKEVIKMLLDRGYDSDPVKAWKESQGKATDDDTESGASEEISNESDFNYLLKMPLWSFSKDQEDLLKQRDGKQKELDFIKALSVYRSASKNIST